MIYLAPKLSDYRKAVEGYILFEGVPSDDQKRTIAALLPFPLTMSVKWNGHVLHFASDDVFSFRVKQTYGGLMGKIGCAIKRYDAEATVRDLSRFFLALERAVKKIDQIAKIVAFIMPPSDAALNFDEQFHDGGRYACAGIIRTQLIPFLMGALETGDKGTIAWIISHMFAYIPKSEIDAEYGRELAQLIEHSVGADPYIDRVNERVLNQIRASGP